MELEGRTSDKVMLVGPDLNAIAKQILDWAEIDKGLKEPLRKRLKEWQKGVVAKMKAEAPDDPQTSGPRIKAALKAKAPVISRGRQRIYASFVTDTAYLNRHMYDYSKSRAKARPVWAGTAWAIVQHEDLTLHHSRGGAKFMERPFVAGCSQIQGVLEAAFAEIQASIEAR